jgi:hypothetical protein
MIRCDECLRANPPTRVACLYCSASLPITESSAQLRRPVLRPPEKHQSAYSNILLPSQGELSSDVIAEAADLLKLSPENLQRIAAQKTPLPVAFTASREEAELIFNRLRDLGLPTIIVGDESLDLSAVKRIKAIGGDDQYAVLQQAGTRETTEVRWDDVSMIITGRLFVRRMEIQERKTRRPENEIVHASEFSSDEAVIDLCSAPDLQTWRVSANGFDFSCLGERMTLIANENIATLQQLILEHAGRAKLNDSYNKLRNTLDLVWGPQQETQSSGWRRERPGKLSVGVATVKSNESQFTRYSRLQTYLHFNLRGTDA